MLEIPKTRIVKLQDKKLNEIYEKIQKSEGVTSEELNKLWNYFSESNVKHSADD